MPLAVPPQSSRTKLRQTGTLIGSCSWTSSAAGRPRLADRKIYVTYLRAQCRLMISWLVNNFIDFWLTNAEGNKMISIHVDRLLPSGKTYLTLIFLQGNILWGLNIQDTCKIGLNMVSNGDQGSSTSLSDVILSRLPMRNGDSLKLAGVILWGLILGGYAFPNMALVIVALYGCYACLIYALWTYDFWNRRVPREDPASPSNRDIPRLLTPEQGS